MRMKTLHILCAGTHRLTFIFCFLIFTAWRQKFPVAMLVDVPPSLQRQQRIVPYAFMHCYMLRHLSFVGHIAKNHGAGERQKYSNCKNKSRARRAPDPSSQSFIVAHNFLTSLCWFASGEDFHFWAKTTFSRKYANHLFIYCFFSLHITNEWQLFRFSPSPYRLTECQGNKANRPTDRNLKPKVEINDFYESISAFKLTSSGAYFS